MKLLLLRNGAVSAVSATFKFFLLWFLFDFAHYHLNILRIWIGNGYTQLLLLSSSTSPLIYIFKLKNTKYQDRKSQSSSSHSGQERLLVLQSMHMVHTFSNSKVEHLTSSYSHLGSLSSLMDQWRKGLQMEQLKSISRLQYVFKSKTYTEIQKTHQIQVSNQQWCIIFLGKLLDILTVWWKTSALGAGLGWLHRQGVHHIWWSTQVTFVYMGILWVESSISEPSHSP